MYRVLFVYGGIFANGGTESVMLNIFKNIDRKMFSIDFLILCDEEDYSRETDYLKQNGSHIYYVVSRGKDWNRHKRELKTFFSEHKYDIVHTHMNALGNEVLKIAFENDVSVRIAHSHNTSHQLKVKTIKDFLHFVYLEAERRQIRKNANYYIGCSELAGRWLFGSKVNRENYMNLQNAICVEDYMFDERVRDEVRTSLGLHGLKIIGHVGRFSYQKNHTFLIEVFNEMLKIRTDIKLVLVGDGEEYANITDLVKNMNLEDKVMFLGNCNEVNRILQAMDLFIFPSRYEGLPLALVEAQASGLECLVSDRVSEECNITGKVCFLDIESDAKKWAEQACEKLDFQTARNSDISKIRENGFDIKYNIKKLEEFYLNAIQMNELGKSKR